MYPLKTVLPIVLLFICSSSYGQTITTFAGRNTPGFSGDGGRATSAQLNEPYGIAVDDAGNLYIADGVNRRIRKVDANGIITTIAGNGAIGFNGDGIAATDAAIDVTNVTVSASGIVYITDGYNNRVRVVTTDGMITTIAGNGSPSYSGDGGPATDAALNSPADLKVDTFGNVYIADLLNNRVRKVTTDGNIITVAGNGSPYYNGDGEPATTAQLNSPYGVAVDDTGTLYIAEFNGQRIRKVSTAGIISTFAGTGINGYSGDGAQAAMAQLSYPRGVTVDNTGNVYITDFGNERIRKVHASGIITTVAGNGTAGFKGDGGPASAANLSDPVYTCVDPAGNIYVADRGNNKIREIYPYNVGVKNIANPAQELQIWPQPNSGVFSMFLSSDLTQPLQIIITNLIGQEIKESSSITNNQIEIQLSVPAGMYFITTVTAQKMQTAKLMVR
jgi:sugar lactone lactonase YvrE